jgi:hypothetical protein
MYNLRSRDKEDRSIISEKDDDSVCEAKPSRSHTSALRKSRKVAEVLFEIQVQNNFHSATQLLRNKCIEFETCISENFYSF